MAISPTHVKELRELTGAGMLDCKKALEDAKGDLERAKEILRKKGIDVAARKAERATAEGLVHAYIHHNSRLGVLIEVNCESDFVARTDDFRALVQQLAIQIAGADPVYVSKDEMPAGSKEDPKAAVLLLQPLLQDESKTVQELVNDTIAKTGENIRVRRFARFQLGG